MIDSNDNKITRRELYGLPTDDDVQRVPRGNQLVDGLFRILCVIGVGGLGGHVVFGDIPHT